MRPVDWRIRAYAATHGTLTGAIIRCACPYTDTEDHRPPKFVGKASITSDGFVMCDYVTRDGEFKPGAFIGDVGDLEDSIVKLANYLKLNANERRALYSAIQNWIGVDYSGRPGLNLGT